MRLSFYSTFERVQMGLSAVVSRSQHIVCWYIHILAMLANELIGNESTYSEVMLLMVASLLWPRVSSILSPRSSSIYSSASAVGDLQDFIVNSNRLVCLTGAGISTSSGIPDYRGPNGSYRLEALQGGSRYLILSTPYSLAYSSLSPYLSSSNPAWDTSR